MKRVSMHCPYCGAPAIKRPANYVYGDKCKTDGFLYVCSKYPQCDSYVAAHKKSGLPMGTLASKELRTVRIKAHKALDKIWKSGYMSKDEVYKWLQARMDLPESELHIGKFSEYYCKIVIAECNRAYRNMRIMI